MNQPVPEVTAIKGERGVRRDVPAEEASEVLAALDIHGTRDWHRAVLRVRRAEHDQAKSQQVIDADGRQYRQGRERGSTQ